MPEAQRNDPHAVATVLARRGKRSDCEFLTSTGTTRTVSYSLTEIVDEGAVVGYLGAGEDVTERVRAEQALTTALQRESQAVQRLREVDQLKADLVSNVSHELRTPLTSVAGYLELVAGGEYGDLSLPLRRALDRMATNTRRLERLVDDLLTLGASETGHFVLDPVEVDLRELVESLADLMEELCRGREVELWLDPGTEPVPLRADPTALERVLLNLVGNAVKFTEGAGSVRVQVRPGPQVNGRPRGAQLVVRDNGIGIDPEARSHLFSRFYRAPGVSARAIPGSGLGLSIVQSIVNAHGGDIDIDSQPGVGTTVTVRLPADPLNPLRSQSRGAVATRASTAAATSSGASSGDQWVTPGSGTNR